MRSNRRRANGLNRVPCPGRGVALPRRHPRLGQYAYAVKEDQVDDTAELPRHSIGQTVLLHLAPGAAMALVYAAVGIPIARATGLPSLVSLVIAALLVLVPWELGWLLKQGRDVTGRWTLEGVVLYRERIPLLKLVLAVLAIIVVAIAVVGGLSFIDAAILGTLFAWVPEWYQLVGFEPPGYSYEVYRLITPFNILVSGIALPWIEELYFRGFLLPRIRWMGWKAPVLNSALFALYHFWTPWMAVTRFIFLLPLAWLVHHFRSVKIGVWAHCLLNTIGILLTYGLIMSTAG